MPSEKEYLEKWIAQYNDEIERADKLRQANGINGLPGSWESAISAVKQQRDKLQARLNEINANETNITPTA